ncbi:unannotated protein [freshwater metagenome]|uniref:Unannotated protein n=1 Tax=freshwater metagenome TaxID=449393 RepID=A0A6J6G2Z4_9ZZZZ
MTPPSATVPVLFLISPGRLADNVSENDVLRSTPNFSAVLRHGVAPMRLLRSASLKASTPPTNCSVASRVVFTVRPSTVRLTAASRNGPLGPLIWARAMLASAGDSNG